MRGTCCKTTHRWIYSPLIDIPFRLSPPVNNLRALRSESDEIRFGKLNFNARASTIELRSMERTRHIMEREKVFLKASKIINEKETREREILGFEYSLLSKNDGGKFNPETVHSGFCSIGFSRKTRFSRYKVGTQLATTLVGFPRYREETWHIRVQPLHPVVFQD